MENVVHLAPLDRGYPQRLGGLPWAPASLSTCGGALEAEHVVAIVGSRRHPLAAGQFARMLARRCATAGVVVASGGAVGIDTWAHRGALEGDGRTWVVAGTGCDHVFPPQNASLFRRIAAGPGAMIWPFAPSYRARSAFLYRNRVLVGLADAVVVAQARMPSGALHAAEVARELGKPLWVVPVSPWSRGSEGSLSLLAQPGVRPLTAVGRFLETLCKRPCPSVPADREAATRPFSKTESSVLAATSTVALHLDHVAERAQLSAQATATALLTLSLENVVVEGPPGFFRRRDAPNH